MRQKRQFVADKICEFVNDQQQAGNIRLTDQGAEALELFLNNMLKKEIRDLDFAFWQGSTNGVDIGLSFSAFMEQNYTRA
jgi:type IV pilus biogenesis protein CpaD/CtpE